MWDSNGPDNACRLRSTNQSVRSVTGTGITNAEPPATIPKRPQRVALLGCILKLRLTQAGPGELRIRRISIRITAALMRVDARIIGNILVDFAAQADYLQSCNALRCCLVMQDSLATYI